PAHRGHAAPRREQGQRELARPRRRDEQLADAGHDVHLDRVARAAWYCDARTQAESRGACARGSQSELPSREAPEPVGTDDGGRIEHAAGREHDAAHTAGRPANEPVGRTLDPLDSGVARASREHGVETPPVDPRADARKLAARVPTVDDELD